MEEPTPQPAEASETASPAGEKRKRGGQPGNRNALKHGLYSRFFLPDEKKSLENESLGKLDDEIELLQAYIYRTLKYFTENPPANELAQLTTIHSLTAAMTCLQGFYRTKKAVFDDGQTPLQRALERFKYIPFEED